MPRPAKGPRLGRKGDSPHFVIYYNDGGGTRSQSTGTADPKQAEKELERFLRERHRPLDQRAPERFPVAEAITRYLAGMGDRPGADTSSFNAARILDYWGNSMVSGVTKASVHDYIKQRRATQGLRGRMVSDHTIARELAILRKALNDAVKDEILSRAPFIPAPATNSGRDLWLEKWEAELIAQNATAPHIRLFTIVALHTGARRAAVLEMKWDQIDLANRLVYLNPKERAQTSKRRSTVPMTPTLFAALSEAAKKAGKYVIEHQGAPVRDIKRGFRRSCQKAAWAAIAVGKKGRRVERQKWATAARKLRITTPHVLRHTAGTWMAQAGMSLPKIGEWLGHSNEKTTRKYAHHHPGHLREGVEALEGRGAPVDKAGLVPSAQNPKEEGVDPMEPTP